MAPVLLAGAYGIGDPGNESRLRSFVDALGPDHVVVTTRTPVATARTLGCGVVRPTAAGVITGLRGAGAVVVGGGAIFSGRRSHDAGPPPADLRGVAALAHAARTRRIPVALVGVGAAELRSATERRLARRVVKMADLLVLRDEHSAAALAMAGAPSPFRIGADPAWSAVPVMPGSTIRGQSVLVTLGHSMPPEAASRLAAALRPLASAGWSIELQPWDTSRGASDGSVAMLAQRIGSCVRVVPPPADLAEAAAQMGGHRLVVGSRVSALVAAAAAGSPFIAIAHEPGAAALARRFGQRSVPAHAPVGVLTRTIGFGAEQSPPERDAVRAEIQRAQDGHDLLRLVVDHARTGPIGDVRGLDLLSESTHP